MEPINLQTYVQTPKINENFSCSKQILATATSTDKAVAGVLKDQMSSENFNLSNNLKNDSFNKESLNENTEDVSVDEINENEDISFEDSNDEMISYELDMDEEDNLFEFNDLISEQSDTVKSESIVTKDESIATKDESTSTLSDSLVLTNKGMEENEELISDYNENITDRVDIKNISNQTVKITESVVILKTNVDNEVENKKKLLGNIFSYEIDKQTKEFKVTGNITEGGNRDNRVDFDLNKKEAIGSKNGELKPGMKIFYNGIEYTVRHETKQERKEFEKNWNEYEIALQNQTEMRKLKTEENEKPDEKKELSKKSLDNRVKLDVKSDISQKNSVDILKGIRKNEMLRMALSTLHDRSITSKNKLEKEIQAEEIEKEELKKTINNKNITIEIIKTDTEIQSNKAGLLILKETTIFFNKPYINISVNHELFKLPIRTESKKLN